MNTLEINAQLGQIGLRTRFEVVREVVQRLKNGDSLYSMYNSRFVAKGTAVKIRKLWDAGKLNFLLDVATEMGALVEASADAALAADTPASHHIWSQIETNRQRILEILPQLPSITWDIEYLEKAGIVAEVALGMMIEIDELFRRDMQGERWPKADIVRFVELHYSVLFASTNAGLDNPAPIELIRFAAHSRAVGMVDDNYFMVRVGNDILRYQVWRGAKHLEAFQSAQVHTSRLARRRSQEINQEIERVLQQDATQKDQNG
jgi:hypothetical protein